jgi:hypothetical protein
MFTITPHLSPRSNRRKGEREFSFLKKNDVHCHAASLAKIKQEKRRKGV